MTAELHPGEIRSILRAHALELSLQERADGTFAPIDTTSPLAPSFDQVERLPERYANVLEGLLEGRFGPTWWEGDAGDELRGLIRAFKADYFAGDAVEYDLATALGYAIYHLPIYFASVQYVLDQLGQRGLLSRELRVLDVGAGVGGPALGLAAYVGEEAVVDYRAVEPSAATTVLRAMLRETGPNFHWSIEERTIESFEPTGAYDLVLLANVLSELDEPVNVVRRLLRDLDTDGVLVCVAPADRRTSLHLREVERAIVDGNDSVDVFAPTLRLWPGRRPTDECWSFDERSPISIPRFQRSLDEGSGRTSGKRPVATREFVHREVRFSYSILRRDGRRRSTFRPDRGTFAPLAESAAAVTSRVDIAVVKLSRTLREPGAPPLYRVGDGSQDTPHFAVLTRETTLNEALRTADYGDVVIIEGGLLLWNDDEAAYNVVVDEDAVVDRVPPG